MSNFIRYSEGLASFTNSDKKEPNKLKKDLEELETLIERFIASSKAQKIAIYAEFESKFAQMFEGLTKKHFYTRFKTAYLDNLAIESDCREIRLAKWTWLTMIQEVKGSFSEKEILASNVLGNQEGKLNSAIEALLSDLRSQPNFSKRIKKLEEFDSRFPDLWAECFPYLPINNPRSGISSMETGRLNTFTKLVNLPLSNDVLTYALCKICYPPNNLERIQNSNKAIGDNHREKSILATKAVMFISSDAKYIPGDNIEFSAIDLFNRWLPNSDALDEFLKQYSIIEFTLKREAVYSHSVTIEVEVDDDDDEEDE